MIVLTLPHPPQPVPRKDRQRTVMDWARRCFGAKAEDPVVRRQRFLEEALELHQALGGTPIEVGLARDYVHGRPPGDPFQEVGGVSLTLLSLCELHGIDADAAEQMEIARVLAKSPEHFRARDDMKAEHGL